MDMFDSDGGVEVDATDVLITTYLTIGRQKCPTSAGWTRNGYRMPRLYIIYGSGLEMESGTTSKVQALGQEKQHLEMPLPGPGSATEKCALLQNRRTLEWFITHIHEFLRASATL